jgi:uncharacterized protein
MQRMERWWYLLFTEPFHWLFDYFFRPTFFKGEFEGHLPRRVLFMLRFLLPIFLCIYPLALITRLVLPPFFPDLYVYTLDNAGILRFLTDTAWATAVGMAGGILGAMALNTTIGVTLCINIGLLGGILMDTSTQATDAVEVAVEMGMACGILFGLLFGLTVSGPQGTRASSVLAIILGSIVGCIIGIVVGLIVGFLGGALFGRLPGSTGADTTQSTWGAVIGVVAAVSTMVVINSIVRSLSWRAPANVLRAISVGRSIGIAFSLMMGVVGGAIGVLSSSRNILETGIQYNGYLGVIIGLISGGTFMVCYLIGYFRLPLYPVSAFSLVKTYMASRRHPAEVFSYLRRSSLYWDERVFLPLPYLEETLLIAAKEDVQRTLREIDFILAERPQQTLEARQALIAIALNDLEQRKTLQAIGQAAQRLYEIIPPQLMQVEDPWVQSLTSLADASKNAALSVSPTSRETRQKALDEMIINLSNVRPDIAFEDIRLREYLGRIKKQWMEAALYEIGGLKAGASQQGRLKNPYVCGTPLQRDDSSFVGRHDLAFQLEQALDKEKNRPTFCLIGARRMGKTSTLHHLPLMLSTRYIPLFFDLQQRGNSADEAAFLSTITKQISSALAARGLRIPKLEHATLYQVAIQTNAAKPYFVFDHWLDELEPILALQDLTILLTFDEFEHLQEAHDAKFLDLGLLLDWFRSVIQNRPRLALLFSGVHEFSEMGSGWASHFVNVQTLRVSFLHPHEAYRLILTPTPDYPGEQIYGKGVVEEIMRVTGCHPFLVQAVCSALIDLLNRDRRRQAEKKDVAEAVEHTLRGWQNYFQDLWEGTAREQRLCLFALQQSDHVTLPEIVEQSELSEQTALTCLNRLVKRDLVICEQGMYRIAAPIFHEWLERYRLAK